MNSVLGFLAMLGPLVVVHEFGHYLFAKLFKVKADTFSIGFGPRIWGKQIGETEWRFSLIPLGGYVKLLGEEPGVELSPEEKPRALGSKPRWQRLLIFFGGPLFNFLFAIIVYMAILAMGEPQVASRIARVVPGSIAQQAGFLNGDRILQVNGESTPRFEQVDDVIEKSVNKPVSFLVERGAKKLTLTATPIAKPGVGPFGEPAQVGSIEGLFAVPRALTLGVADPESPAGKAGLKTNEQILGVNGKVAKSWEELEVLFLDLNPGDRVLLTVLGTDKKTRREVSLTVPASKPGFDYRSGWGLYSSELFVEKAVDKSPALAAGLLPGDRIISVGDKELESFFSLRDEVQAGGEREKKVKLTWEHEGKVLTSTLVPTETPITTPTHERITQYTVGIVPMLLWLEPEFIIEPIYNPIRLLAHSVNRVAEVSWKNVVSIAKMFTGEVSIKALGGPLLIGKLAGESLGRGLISFLTMMAVLSIGLGVLNLFPIPVLDGGQIFLLGLESVRGKPLTLAQMERIQMVGLALILLLMTVVMKNDIARLF
jgi:regulator of sigma E protease